MPRVNRTRSPGEYPSVSTELRPSEVVPRLVTPDGASPPEAFDTFYARELRPVVGLVFVLSGSSQVAEETAQDAFLDAYRAWDRIGSFDSPGAWVRRVALNRAVSKVRRRANEARALTRLAGRREAIAPLPAEDEDFWRAVRALPERQAHAVALHYMEDRPVADIALVLGCSEGSVKTHLSRGRAALADALRLHLDQEHLDQKDLP